MQDAVRRHVGQCVSVVHGMPEPSARPFATKSDLVLSDAIFETTTPTITALCGRRTALQLGLRRRRRRRLVTQEREDRQVHVHRWKDRRSRAAPTHVATRCHSQFTRFSETRFSQTPSPSRCDTSPLMGLQCRPAHVSTRLQAARACIHSHLPRLNRLSFFAPLSERC